MDGSKVQKRSVRLISRGATDQTPVRSRESCAGHLAQSGSRAGEDQARKGPTPPQGRRSRQEVQDAPPAAAGSRRVHRRRRVHPDGFQEHGFRRRVCPFTHQTLLCHPARTARLNTQASISRMSPKDTLALGRHVATSPLCPEPHSL